MWCQHLRDRGGLRLDATLVAWKAGRPFCDGTHAHRMGVAARDQRCAGRRAHGRYVEIAITHTTASQGIHTRRLDFGAVAAEIGVADIVKHDEQDVGRTGGGRVWCRPPGLRLTPGPADPAAKGGGLGHRNHSSLRSALRRVWPMVSYSVASALLKASLPR